MKNLDEHVIRFRVDRVSRRATHMITDSNDLDHPACVRLRQRSAIGQPEKATCHSRARFMVRSNRFVGPEKMRQVPGSNSSGIDAENCLSITVALRQLLRESAP